MFNAGGLVPRILFGGAPLRNSLTNLTEFAKSQKVLSMWSRDLSHLDRMKQQKIVDELSSKAQSSGNCRKQKKDEACQTGNNKASASLIPVLSSPVPKHGINYKDPNEDEKKAPILVWINHAVVEMPDEYFDGEHVYTWNHLEYVRVHGSVAEPIKIHRGKFEFNTVMVPAQNRQLLMLVFYGYKSGLCSLEVMRKFVSNYYDSSCPCIVRKANDNNTSPKMSIYLPHWKTKDFPSSRISQHLVATMNLNSLFVAGGFGDLAVEDAVPSATGDPKKVSHLQHFGLLSFRNSPKKTYLRTPEEKTLLGKKSRQSRNKKQKRTNKPVKIPMNEKNANQVELVQYPICVVLWDRQHEIPVYMGKVTGEKTEQEIEEMKLKETEKRQKNWVCC
ncbi:DUF4806 domain-containing protein [Caenorhabditis elegans]|uniref:DUF4806 domain-containing protein n=1 Tax=Caenorhabditis elegans TaxID=6239 RepID=A0A0K3ARU9_CAEEL|nr:DUF4806 domain-containing protein [Caenorhabditis elegans]CTQ86578.1 DUF4806 domain-containing protein [Caenorhabditis elegans]|eukprot:NP_001299878.1 Uncharacterized protein CELE_R01H2.4 [Caenorhabditis elegans]